MAVSEVENPGAGSANPSSDWAGGVADSLTSRQWDELADIVLRRLESNMRVELARRGRLATPRAL